MHYSALKRFELFHIRLLTRSLQFANVHPHDSQNHNLTPSVSHLQCVGQSVALSLMQNHNIESMSSGWRCLVCVTNVSASFEPSRDLHKRTALCISSDLARPNLPHLRLFAYPVRLVSFHCLQPLSRLPQHTSFLLPSSLCLFHICRPDDLTSNLICRLPT